MLWLAAPSFGDDGNYAKGQLRKTLREAWRLGFEADNGPTFATCYSDWADNGVQ